MALRTSPRWRLLEEALDFGPGELAFRAASAALLAFDGEERAEAYAYALARLSRWGDDTRIAPWTWACALSAGEAEPVLALARTLRLDADHLGAEPVSLARLDAAHLGGITTIRSQGSAEPSVYEVLASRPTGYLSLRHVAESYADDDLDGPLCACTWFPSATDIDITNYRHLFGDAPPAPGQEARSLEALSTEAEDLAELVRYLDTYPFPALRSLRVRHSYFSVVPGTTPDFSNAQVLGSLDELSLWQYPTRTLRALFEAGHLRLRSLQLRGHGRVAYGGIEKHDVTLSPRDIAALLSSKAVESLERLAVTNEHLGETLVDLVAGTTPGALRELVLDDVMLDDEAVARLSSLPHIRYLERLSLRGNPFGERGLSSLCASLRGGPLRALAVGCSHGSPYYIDARPQPGGDAMAQSVARTELPSLQELSLTRLRVGPSGARALAESGAQPALERLALHHAELGSDGVGALLSGPLVRRLVSLTLDDCRVDDEGAAAISRGGFKRLRELSLGYSNIGPLGASALADAECLRTLYRLSLHDAFVGNRGMVALARSRHLSRLVELDLEQDCWTRAPRRLAPTPRARSPRPRHSRTSTRFMAESSTSITAVATSTPSTPRGWPSCRARRTSVRRLGEACSQPRRSNHG